MQLIVGPHRVFPGRLSVSRTIGDIEAKDPKYGGNPNVVIPKPDIKQFKIRNNYDFIVIGCDGIFEKLNNQEVVNSVWQMAKGGSDGSVDYRSIHEKCGAGVDRVLHTSAYKKTFDNITAVMIAFENFENIAGDAVANEEAKAVASTLDPVEEDFVENEEADTPIENNNSEEKGGGKRSITA